MSTDVEFDTHESARLAVWIRRKGRTPLIGALHGALVALGLVVASYHVRTGEEELVEYVEIEPEDGTGRPDILTQTQDALRRVVEQAGG